jgi:hypothetical protein
MNSGFILVRRLLTLALMADFPSAVNILVTEPTEAMQDILIRK